VSAFVAEPSLLDRVDRWGRSHGWAADALTALTCAAILGPLSISTAAGVHWSPAWSGVLVASVTVLHASVALRSHAPAVSYAIAGAAMLLIVFAPDGRIADPTPAGPTHVAALFLPSNLVFLFPLYSAAERLDTMRSRVALAAALVGVATAAATAADVLRDLIAGNWLVPVYLALALAVGVLLTWNLGRLAQVRRVRLARERAESARLAVLEERQRISREMHDIVAHSLAVIVRQAEGGASVAGHDPDRATAVLQTIADTGRGALTDMRGLLGVLRDPDVGVAAPQPGVADLPGLLDGVRETGMHVGFTVSGQPFPIRPATGLAVYRLVQEGLTNAVKHAGPHARVDVSLRWEAGRLTVEVSDDGAGPTVVLPGTGAGLSGLRDRVTAAGGTFGVERLEPGFRIRACFPRVAS
jgi:signal transduction histidine kinase